MDLRAEKERLERQIENSDLANALKKQLTKELEAIFVDLATRRTLGLRRLAELSGRLPRKERRPFTSLVEALSSSKAWPTPALPQEPLGADIAILCASRHPELKSVLDLLGDIEELQISTGGQIPARTYYRGRFVSQAGVERQPTVVATHQVRGGMVDAAVLASEMLLHWHPRLLTMIGSCCAWKSKGVQKGDLVVPNDIHVYGLGRWGRGSEVESQIVSIPDGVVARIQAAANRIASKISEEWTEERQNALTVHVKPLACGPTMPDKANLFNDEIAEMRRKTVGTDGESFSVVRATELLSGIETIPLVVKGVAKVGHSRETKKDREFAAFASARFLYHFALSDMQW